MIFVWRESEYDFSVFAAAVSGSGHIYAGEVFSLAQKLQPQIQLETFQDTVHGGVHLARTVAAAGFLSAKERGRGGGKARIYLLDRRFDVQRYRRRCV